MGVPIAPDAATNQMKSAQRAESGHHETPGESLLHALPIYSDLGYIVAAPGLFSRRFNKKYKLYKILNKR